MKTVNHKHATGFFFTLTAIVFALICHHFAFVPACRGAQNKGIKVVIADPSGQRVGLYEGSYALLIGISDYTAGWPDLGSVPGELDRVETVLKKQGFEVYMKHHVLTGQTPPATCFQMPFF